MRVASKEFNQSEIFEAVENHVKQVNIHKGSEARSKRECTSNLAS